MRSIQLITWPHATQGLILQPIAGLMGSGLIRINSPRPGLLIEYAENTDLDILYVMEQRALMVGWCVEMAINTEINRGTLHPYRAAQWAPVVTEETLHSGVESEWLWYAHLSGTPRVRTEWNAAPGANCRMTLKPYDDGTGNYFDMTAVVLPNNTDDEIRVIDGTYPSDASNVVEGQLYRIGVTQNSGNDRVLTLDMGVEEIGGN